MSETSSPVTCGRLIVDPPLPGDWNMAVDEALLESAAVTRAITLRFYGWNTPTLSLGYFQRAADRQQHAASQACPVVRRQTGGGAILHDAELTYSITVPVSCEAAARPQLLYDHFHETLIVALREFGVSTELCGAPSASCEEPFLCFQRRAVGDVLLGYDKIGGSAQRRRGGAVLQHGSVLLRRSAQAPELLGIKDLANTVVGVSELHSRWANLLERRLGVHWEPSAVSVEELQRAEAICREKFAADDWTNRR